MKDETPRAEEDRSREEDELVRLMVSYQAGRLEGFERLYAALAADLRRFFAAAAAAEAGAVDDLLQETFLEVHRARRTYLPPLPVRPWVFGVAHNVLRRHRRTARRRAQREDPRPAGDELESMRLPVAASVEPGDLAQALGRLPAARRRAWLLHHVHGYSFQQIAEMLRIGVDAAKLRSSRAMKALRAALGIERGRTE